MDGQFIGSNDWELIEGKVDTGREVVGVREEGQPESVKVGITVGVKVGDTFVGLDIGLREVG